MRQSAGCNLLLTCLFLGICNASIGLEKAHEQGCISEPLVDTRPVKPSNSERPLFLLTVS